MSRGANSKPSPATASLEVPEGGITETDTTAEIRFGAPDDDTVAHELVANEEGLKDTIRVNPNEVLDIALRFDPTRDALCTIATSLSTRTAT